MPCWEWSGPCRSSKRHGAAEYGQAGREREGVQGLAANVLKTTLEGKHLDIEKLGMQERLRALEQQIAYQNAQLALMGRQQTEAERQKRSRGTTPASPREAGSARRHSQGRGQEQGLC